MGFGIGDVVSIGSGGLIDGDELLGGITGQTGADAARNAAQAQLQGIRESNALLRELANAQIGITDYSRGIGNQALGLYGSMYGLTPGYNPAGTYKFGEDGKLEYTAATPGGGSATGTGVPDYSAFYRSPDFLFAQEQGEDAINRAAAAGGSLFSGSRLKEASRFNTGLASQSFNNFANRLAGLAGVGTTQSNQLSQTLGNTGANLANNALASGQARASGYTNAYGAQQQGLNNLLGIGGIFAGII